MGRARELFVVMDGRREIYLFPLAFLWVSRAERDQGLRVGMTSSDRDRLKELERESRELKRANEILRKASAFFAQTELDRRAR